MDLSTESEQTTLFSQLVATAEHTNLALQLTHALGKHAIHLRSFPSDGGAMTIRVGLPLEDPEFV
jgi:hypothetical protein